MSALVGLAALGGILVVGGAATAGTAREARGKGAALAIPTAPEVPGILRPWTEWAIHGHERERCPTVAGADKGEAVVCVWAGRLALALDDRGGSFRQDLEVFAPGAVPLPGNAAAWPLDLTVDGHAAVVIPAGSEGEGPAAYLLPGRHTVQGVFAWQHLPESLPVPPSTGLLGLTLRGQAVELPNRSATGELFLQKQEEEAAEEDQLDIAVHRRLLDEVPMLLTTRLVLNVSGKTREVVLGRSLPRGFVPHAIDATLPVRIEADGRLRVQLRPGTFTILLVARQNAAAARVQRPAPDGPWKEGDEVWVFDARPALRTVTIEGVPTIDPQQTTLPDDWKRLPAYLMVPGATMTLSERHRGNADPPADKLTLRRQLWLDFDGGGFTARDQISGTFQRGWRLTMGPESRLGRVSVDGHDQFITRLASAGGEGVEIRQTRASVLAESRIDTQRGDLPAVGWAEDFQSVAAELALPPGWRLVHASGADTVSDTWILGWTLLDLFLLLITGLGIGKVFGWRVGLLALATLGLVLPQGDAPRWIWLAVLIAETLVRALPAGRLRWLARATRLGAWVLLVVVAIPFAIQEIRVGLHPALGGQNGSAGDAGEFLKRRTASVAEEEAPGDHEATIGLALSGRGGLGAIGGKGSAAQRPAPGASYAATQNLASYDPNVMVQTGPGVPRWTWNSVQLGWNGPVEKEQRLRVWLLPPWVNLILGFARVGLTAMLILLMVGGRRGLSDGVRLGSPVVVIPLVLVALGALAPARATAGEIPDDGALGRLRERLLEKPPCHPNCSSIGRLALDAAPDRLRLQLEVGAVAPSTLPLPAHAQHWLPDTVLVDGRPSTALTRAEDGQLWLQLAPGSHQVVMEGPLPARDSVQIPFKLLPHAVTVRAHGWKVDGLTAEGQVDGNLQLSRVAAKGRDPAHEPRKSQGLDSTSLPPFVIVERTLELGLKWQARTRVIRQTSPGAVVVLDVSLLPGESVVTNGVHVVKGHVQVNLDAGETEMSWSSTLAERPNLVLQAPATGSADASSWSEQWFVNASPIWHVVFSGIPPVDAPADAPVRVPGWRPWPGEKVTIAISKPTGTAGQTLTVDHAELSLAPGVRSTQAELSLSLRSSRGGEHALTLPEGAVVDTVAVNGTKQPPRQDARRVTIPVAPGAQTVRVSFRQPVGLTAFFRAPLVDLGLPGVNVEVTISVASDRWILMVGGPRLGPAILFWSFLVVMILIAVALGRTHLAPLSPVQWVLLGLGLSQAEPAAAALVAGAFLAFGWRRRLSPPRRAWVHNLGQIVFALWTILAVAVMSSAIRQGLLGHPDMGIAGNDSYPGTLKWFADRTPGPLPQPWVLSAPLLVYRLFMLAWALWLALAVLRWARWIWDCFTHGSLWRPRERRAKVPVMPPPLPAGAPDTQHVDE